MAVTYVTLYPPGGNSTTVQVVEGSQLHLIYASMGFSSTPSAPGPPKRPDPFPQYVTDEELAEAGMGASDASVAALVADSASETGTALMAAFVAFGPVDPGPSLPPGTEYVWNKTDGAGALLDILSGVA